MFAWEEAAMHVRLMSALMSVRLGLAAAKLAGCNPLIYFRCAH